MNPYKNHTFDELLRMRLNEEVFDRILEILEQKQRNVDPSPDAPDTGLCGARIWGATEKPHILFRHKPIWRPRRKAVTMPIKMEAN